jgi:hypothetical protein
MIALSAFLCTITIHLYFRADKFCKVPGPVRMVSKNKSINKYYYYYNRL